MSRHSAACTRRTHCIRADTAPGLPSSGSKGGKYQSRDSLTYCIIRTAWANCFLKQTTICVSSLLLVPMSCLRQARPCTSTNPALYLVISQHHGLPSGAVCWYVIPTYPSEFCFHQTADNLANGSCITFHGIRPGNHNSTSNVPYCMTSNGTSATK